MPAKPGGPKEGNATGLKAPRSRFFLTESE
jgi:hypothetical protein